VGKTKLRIGLVLAQVPGYSETFITNKIAGLIDEGFEVTVFVDKKSAERMPLANTVTAFQLPSNAALRLVKTLFVCLYAALKNPVRLCRLILLERKGGASWHAVLRSVYTGAHILPCRLHRLHFGFATLAVGREYLGKVMGARISVSFRGYDISLFPLRQPDVYDKLWRTVDKVHTISDDLYQQALKLGLSPHTPHVKITPAINAEKFTGARHPEHNENVINILTISRLQWKKGLEVALDAMKILKTRGVQFSYTIVGTGNDIDRLFYARYQNDLEKEVIFAGRKTHDEVALLMKENSIYLQPSLQEGFCNSVLEAQASGMLTIVTNAEGLTENVLDNETGWVVPKWNAKAIAEKIVFVSNLPVERRSEVTGRAVIRVNNFFSLDTQKRSFADFYR
jgi:colanic acid/amylovoran biosynthesis glycosyltransferase